MSTKRKHIEQFWKKYSPNSKSHLDELVNNNAITPFIGAGMSIAYGLPSWTSFLQDLIEKQVSNDNRSKFKKLLKEGKYLEVASEIDFEMNHGASFVVSETFSKPKLNDKIPNYIGILNSKGINSFVTTNYDEVIETLYDQLDAPFLHRYLPNSGDIDMSYQEAGRRGNARLLKLHGTHSNLSSIVLTKQQYDKCYGKKSPINAILQDLWISSTLLFLGCSLYKDPLVENLYKIAGQECDIFHYAILEYPANNKRLREQEQWLTKLHIKPIWYPPTEYDSITTILSMLCGHKDTIKETLITSSGIIDDISHEYLDPIAQKAFAISQHRFIFDTILQQATLSTKPTLKDLSLKLRTSNYTLAIKGYPGTGKSTLLSLLYLYAKKQSTAKDKHRDELFFLIDLHHYDTFKISKARTLLSSHLKEVRNQFGNYKKIILFVDGINEYSRIHNQLQETLLNTIVKWLKDTSIKNKISIAFSIGKLDEDISNLGPFVRNNLTIPCSIKYEINLNYLESEKYDSMIRQLAKFRKVFPKQTPEQERNIFLNNFSTYWKKVSGSYSDFRTAYFLINNFADNYRNKLFTTPVGELFYNYFAKTFNGTPLNIKEASRKIAHFMLDTNNEISTPSIPHYVYKSPTIRDFFLAFHYVDSIKEGNLEELRIYNLIFTLRINRYVVSLMKMTNRDESEVVEKCVELYQHLSLPQKNQIVYLLGRVESTAASKKACAFLCEQYKDERARLISYTSDEEMMLFRSIGISLLYLNCTDFLDDFLTLIIYNERMSKVNRNFHVQYYDQKKSKLEDELHIKNSDCCSSSQLLELYHHLRTSSHSSEPLRYISIVTMLNIVVYNHYINNMGKHFDYNPEDFEDTLSELCNDTSIGNTVVRQYIRDVKEYITSPNVYSKIVNDVYCLKDIVRKGWTKRERQVENPENVPSHCWSACMLAEMFLAKDLQECPFASDEEKANHYEEYNKGHILELLLIHDLAETYIGDVTPDSTSYDSKSERELSVFNRLRVLSSFPNLGSFQGIGKLGDEFIAGSTFNAQIANDFDQLDALVQVYVYRNRFPIATCEKVKNEWIKYVDGKLKTTLGRNLFSFIQDALFNYDYAPRKGLK